jgi:hypothetical protein
MDLGTWASSCFESRAKPGLLAGSWSPDPLFSAPSSSEVWSGNSAHFSKQNLGLWATGELLLKNECPWAHFGLAS